MRSNNGKTVDARVRDNQHQKYTKRIISQWLAFDFDDLVGLKRKRCEKAGRTNSSNNLAALLSKSTSLISCNEYNFFSIWSSAKCHLNVCLCANDVLIIMNGVACVAKLSLTNASTAANTQVVSFEFYSRVSCIQTYCSMQCCFSATHMRPK